MAVSAPIPPSVAAFLDGFCKEAKIKTVQPWSLTVSKGKSSIQNRNRKPGGPLKKAEEALQALEDDARAQKLAADRTAEAAISKIAFGPAGFDKMVGNLAGKATQYGMWGARGLLNGAGNAARTLAKPLGIGAAAYGVARGGQAIANPIADAIGSGSADLARGVGQVFENPREAASGLADWTLGIERPQAPNMHATQALPKQQAPAAPAPQAPQGPPPSDPGFMDQILSAYGQLPEAMQWGIPAAAGAYGLYNWLGRDEEQQPARLPAY